MWFIAFTNITLVILYSFLGFIVVPSLWDGSLLAYLGTFAIGFLGVICAITVTNSTRAMIHRHRCLRQKVIFEIDPRLVECFTAGEPATFRFRPDVAEWCEHNLKGKAGVLPGPLKVNDRWGWFDSQDDAFLFRMTWG